MSEIKRLLNSLLWEIYGRIPSSISRKHRRSRQMKMHPRLYEPRLLAKLNHKVLRDISAILKLEIRLMSKYLERVLISRDKNRTQQTILYGFLDVIVSSRLGESSREMRFSLSPPPGTVKKRGDPGRPITADETNSSSDFNQWLHAMKMVARLPGGMPPEFRRKLWLALAEKYLKSKNVDWEKEEVKCFSEQWREDDEELGIQIVKDLHRTGSSLCSGPAGTINQAKLKRILLGYARYNPEVGYCQGFNMLGALILQVMDKEEIESIKVMIYLVEGILPRGYFSGSLGGLQADMAVFRELMTCKLPRLAKHLQKLQGPVENAFEPPLTNVFTMQWFLTMFCTCLPMTCVLRVWDLVLIEGSDVLLRTALVLWSLLEERILSARTADDFYCKMGSFSSELLNGHLIDSNGLIEKVVDLGPIPELQKLRDKHLYNISPFRDKKGLQLYYSDEEGDSDEDSRMAVATAWGLRLSRRGSAGLSNKSDGKDRIALDISLLKKQYDRLRERQRQAHIILTSAVARQGSNPNQSSIQMNQLLIGRNAIVTNNGRRLGPPQGAIPPARKPSLATAKSSAPAQTKSARRGETLHWRDTDLSKRRRGSLKWKDIKSSSAQLSQDDRTSQLIDSAPSSRSSSSEPKSQRASFKTHQRSDSSSYSEDSDGNSSTSTSLCDEDDHEIGDNNVSSLEGSPLKKSKSSKKHSEVPQKKCLEDVLNSNEKPHTVDSQIPFIQLTTMGSPLLNANKTDIDTLEYVKEDSETESNRLDYAGFVDEYSWPDMKETTMTTPPEDVIVDVSSDKKDFLSVSNVISSTNQLSPMPDIATYINSSCISPLRTPISTFDYANLVASVDDSKRFNVNDEGVTNEYFERINIVERPTKLDLLYSLNEEDSIRNAFNVQSDPPSPEQALSNSGSLPKSAFPESSTFPAEESNAKHSDSSTEELSRKMKVLLEYSNQSSLSFIAEAKHEISSGLFKEKEFDPASLKYEPLTLVPLNNAFSASETTSTDECSETTLLVPSITEKPPAPTCKIEETADDNQTSLPVDSASTISVSREDIGPNTNPPSLNTEFFKEKTQTLDSWDTDLNKEKKILKHIPSTEDLETRFRALNFSDTTAKSNKERAEDEWKQPAPTRISEEVECASTLKTPVKESGPVEEETLSPEFSFNQSDVEQISQTEKLHFDKTDLPGKTESFSESSPKEAPFEHTISKHMTDESQKDNEINPYSLPSTETLSFSQKDLSAEEKHGIIDEMSITPLPTTSLTYSQENFNDNKPSTFSESNEENSDLQQTVLSPRNSKSITLDREKSDTLIKEMEVSQVQDNFVEIPQKFESPTERPTYLEVQPTLDEEIKEDSSVLNPVEDQTKETKSDKKSLTLLSPYSENHFGEKQELSSCSTGEQTEQTRKKVPTLFLKDTEQKEESGLSTDKSSMETTSPQKSKIPSTEDLETRFKALERQFSDKTIAIPKKKPTESEPGHVSPASAKEFDASTVDAKAEDTAIDPNLTKPETKSTTPKAIPTTADLERRFRQLEENLSTSSKLIILPQEDAKTTTTQSNTGSNPSVLLRSKTDVRPKSLCDSSTLVKASIDEPAFIRKRIPSTEDLESRFKALEIQKTLKSPISVMSNLLSPSNAKIDFPNPKPEVSDDSKRKSDIPSTEDLENRFQALEQSKLQGSSSEFRDMSVVITKPECDIPSTKELEIRFEAFEQQKTLTNDNTDNTVSLPDKKPLESESLSSTVDLEARFEQQMKCVDNTVSLPDKKPLESESLPSTVDLEARFEQQMKCVADDKAKSSTILGESRKKDQQKTIPSTEDLEIRFKTLESSVENPDAKAKDTEKQLPSTQDLEDRFNALEQKKSKTENPLKSEAEKQDNLDPEASAQPNKKPAPSTKDLESRFEILEQSMTTMKSYSNNKLPEQGDSKKSEDILTRNTDLQQDKLLNSPLAGDSDTSVSKTEPKSAEIIDPPISTQVISRVELQLVKKDNEQTLTTDQNKRRELYKLESQSDETLTATDPTSTEFDTKAESRPTSCPEYSDPFDSNTVNTDRVLKIIEENSKILHRILKKTLADAGDMETNSQPKRSHQGLTDSLLALGNIFPRTEKPTDHTSAVKSNLWIRPSITLRSDDNISDRLASIKSTIKSIDTLCEEKSFRKEKCQRYIDSLFARPKVATTATTMNPSIKVDDFECKPSQERVAKREMKKDISPRRRRDEEREEYESRVRRDMMPNSLDASSDLSCSLVSIDHVDNEVDRINQGKQPVDTQLERPLSPYYGSGYDLNKRSITPVVYIPTKLEIRHTTVTSTFYDRYLTEKHIEKTFPKSKRSPVSPTITKSYLDISKFASPNLNDRSSKSAENSPSRRNLSDGLSSNEKLSSVNCKTKNPISTLDVAQQDLHIQSCDNILLQLQSSTNNKDIEPSTTTIMAYNPLPAKIRKPPELGIRLGLYKDYGSDESSKS